MRAGPVEDAELTLANSCTVGACKLTREATTAPDLPVHDGFRSTPNRRVCWKTRLVINLELSSPAGSTRRP